MIEEQQIYLLLQKYFKNAQAINRHNLALDLLSILGCQNISLIQSIHNGREHDEHTLKELQKMIECYDSSVKTTIE